MDPQEIRDKILASINNVIRNEDDEAIVNLHDVLAAKMRARINPQSEETPTEEEVDLTAAEQEEPPTSETEEQPTTESVEEPGEE